MSVDFPTPEDPSRTPVRPRPRCAASASTPSPRCALATTRGHARRGAAHDGERGLDVGDEIGLVEHEHVVAAAGGGHGHQALEAPGVEVAVGGGDDEGDVDVGGELLAGAGQHAAARQPGVDDAVVVDDDPVADGRVLGYAAGDDGERLARAGRPPRGGRDGRRPRARACRRRGLMLRRQRRTVRPSPVLRGSRCSPGSVWARRWKRPSAPRRRAGGCRGGAAEANVTPRRAAASRRPAGPAPS